jgi:hypothetical protein
LTGATGCKGGLLVTITLPGARLKKYRQEAIDNDWHLTG